MYMQLDLRIAFGFGVAAYAIISALSITSSLAFTQSKTAGQEEKTGRIDPKHYVHRAISAPVKADRFHVKWSEVLTAVDDFHVDCSNDILIEGALLGACRIDHDGSLRGVTLHLRSASRIVIKGTLRAGDGIDAMEDGINGGDAGTLILEAPLIEHYGGELIGANRGDALGDGAQGGRGGNVTIKGWYIGPGIRGGNGGSGGRGLGSSSGGAGGVGGNGGTANAGSRGNGGSGGNSLSTPGDGGNGGAPGDATPGSGGEGGPGGESQQGPQGPAGASGSSGGTGEGGHGGNGSPGSGCPAL